MHPNARLCAITVLLSAARIAPAWGWGAEGHEAIAATAAANLKTTGRAGVAKILGDGQLESVATWPDLVRDALKHQGALKNDPEAKEFNHDHPTNREWHFVDLPLGIETYDATAAGAGPDDVVHGIERCITILETASEDPRFTKLEALRFLVHLVGDIHQPLHASTGYYTVKGTGAHAKATLVTDPTKAKGKDVYEDVGGNDLCLRDPAAGGTCTELHAHWDADLVKKVASSVPKLVEKLEGDLASEMWKAAHADAIAKADGDYHHWPEIWAIQSVHAAREAYKGIAFENVLKQSKKTHSITLRVQLPGTYNDDQHDRVETQLAAAAAHLEQLMDALQWK